MKRTFQVLLVAVAAILSASGHNDALAANQNSWYEVKDTVMTTYPFSDPNPVPTTGKIYPYFRYDTYSTKSVAKKWTMVVLESKYLRVKIFPQIGGKIWSVYDKTHNKELFYDNDVVKFREISLRGPWTSGGIEFNYGVIGHAPSCASPVDYKVANKEDGSVSCYIGVLELLTQTRWMVEINLPKDAVWVRTSSLWHNYSGTYQPYYNWFNSGVTASNDLKLIYPGTFGIAHTGETDPFPIDAEGHDLSSYADQGFGADKSIHPGGTHKGYFGAYYANNDYGLLHYANRDDKLGRKYFTWAQSGQGSIWINLLTDNRPQYVELQSGRLFNQNLFESSSTPFKQFTFSPFGTDKWSEYWLPFAGIGGVSDMNMTAVVNASRDNGNQVLRIYAIQRVAGKVELKDATGKVLASQQVSIDPSESKTITFSLQAGDEPAAAFVDGRRLWSADEQLTERPDKINKDFDKSSLNGHTLMAYSHLGLRNYVAAETEADEALKLDPSSITALNIKAQVCLRDFRNQEAYDVAAKALAVDTYDPQANYLSGVTAMRLGKVYDAMDGFELASITSELRGAATLQLARIHFKRGDRDLAKEYVSKSLDCNANNISALELLYEIEPSEKTLKQIESLDPLCHFPDAERLLAGKLTTDELDASIKEEMKWQNYLELAVMYHELGIDNKAVSILSASKTQNALIELWKAYLKNDKAAIASAEKTPLNFAFPFRGATLAPLEWAVANGGQWQSHYLLAILKDYLNDKSAALELISTDDSDFAPYYAYRSYLRRAMANAKDATNKTTLLAASKADMEKALKLDATQWRYRQALAQSYYDEKNYAKALNLTEKYYQNNKENFHIGDIYVKSLIALGRYEKADKVLGDMNILPFEGQGGTHVMYRDIKLHLAVKAIDNGKYADAQKRLDESREWPEHLGVGKPYNNLIDNNLEDVLSAIVSQRLGNQAQAQSYMSKLADKDKDGKFRTIFESATTKGVKGYPAVSPLIGNLDANFDKHLF